MFCLHVANRTENLLHHLAEVIRVDRQPEPFAPELFLIQSQGMERMVIQSLSDQFTSFCNYRFFLPLDFLGHIAERLGMGIDPDGFSRKILAWRLDQLLANLEDGCYLPLRNYLSGANLDVKRFQLARRLAHLFDQYQLLRVDLLDAWEKNQGVDSADAAWQRALWRRLCEESDGQLHRGGQLRRVIARLAAEEKLSGFLPKRIAIIGLHTMPPIFLEYLGALSRHMDVHLLLLSPCRKYWGDVVSPRQSLRRKIQAVECESPADGEHHPLLAGLGGQGRELHNLLLEKIPFHLEFASYQQPEGSQPYQTASLLQRIQSDLLDDRLPEQPGAEDGTVQVVSCHSRFREMTVLRDYLLQLLHSDPDLELREIVVMAPDIQEYSALIPAVFGDLGHSVADRPLRRRNRLINAFLAFLDLFSGRFGWSELLDFLSRDSVFPQFELVAADLTQLRQWIIHSGVRWGLSAEQRGEDGLPPFSETSWRAGLDRLLLGYAIDSQESVDGVYPFTEIEGRSALPLGGLCRFIEIVEEGRRDFSRRHRLEEWSKLLLGYVALLFGSDDTADLLELRQIILELEEPLSRFHHRGVAFAVIREWYGQAAAESRSSSGFLRGQLTFCSMLPMRSIPFRVVCLIGLNDGEFPRIDRRDPFDLIALAPRPGDRSARADDRYQFLEALLAARAHLYLSYIGQSIRTNDPIPPSVVVTEFLELLAENYGIRDLVVRHPLHPFSDKYFSGTDGKQLFSYSQNSCAVAKILRQPPQPVVPWWQGELETAVQRIDLAHLLAFYASPQRFFLRHCLDIPLAGQPEVPEEREPFQPSPLARYQLAEELIRCRLAGRDCSEVLDRARGDGTWPLGPSGDLALARLDRQLAPFLKNLAALDLGKACPDCAVDLQLGEYRLTGMLSGVHDHGILVLRNGNLRGQDLFAGWIGHLISGQLGLPARTRVVARDRLIGFSGQPGTGALIALLDHFAAGCRRPSPLLIEPGYAYIQECNNPLARAQRKAADIYATGRRPEWQLLYGETGEGIDWAAFAEVCQELLTPLWDGADVA
jgi:exodeoxyribonuclease V gamma subunit